MDGHTDADNDNNQRPKLALGKKQWDHLSPTTCLQPAVNLASPNYQLCDLIRLGDKNNQAEISHSN